MRFQIQSAYYTCLTDEGVDSYLQAIAPNIDLIKPADSKGEIPKYYVEIDTMEYLEQLVTNIRNAYKERNMYSPVSPPNSVVVDFRDMTITLYDYYLE